MKAPQPNKTLRDPVPLHLAIAALSEAAQAFHLACDISVVPLNVVEYFAEGTSKPGGLCVILNTTILDCADLSAFLLERGIQASAESYLSLYRFEHPMSPRIRFFINAHPDDIPAVRAAITNRRRIRPLCPAGLDRD